MVQKEFSARVNARDCWMCFYSLEQHPSKDGPETNCIKSMFCHLKKIPKAFFKPTVLFFWRWAEALSFKTMINNSEDLETTDLLYRNCTETVQLIEAESTFPYPQKLSLNWDIETIDIWFQWLQWILCKNSWQKLPRKTTTTTTTEKWYRMKWRH